MLVLVFAPAFDAHGSLPKKQVFLLYSEDKAHPAHELTDRGIRAVFQSNKLFDVQLYTEYLDLSRFRGSRHARAMADYLNRKYAGLKIDAIITVYPAAIDFLMGEKGKLFPGVPIVVSGITRTNAKSLERSPWRRLITGVVLGDNIAGIMDSVFRLRPGTKHVALVAGTSPGDVSSESIFRKGLEPYAEKIDLIDLTKLPMQETLSRVGSLPSSTIVLYSSIFTDGAGQNFIPREALALISAAANGPVFSLYDSFMGYGIVGGRLVSFEQQGREAVALALRIMGGESPTSIPFGGEQAYVNLYDWRELKRWGLDESTLPADAIILNKPVSAWESYRLYIIGAAAFCLLETALIIFLIVQRRRKMVAEELLRQKKEELDRFFSVSLDQLCIANTDGYFLRLNPAWERTLGYTLEELMAKRFLEFVHPDDLDRTQQAVSAQASQKELFFENRYRCKDGTYRWLEWSSASDGKLIYAAARDVTERKRAEEEAVQHVKSMESLSETAIGFVELPAETDIYRFIGQKLRQLTEDAIYVSVNAYDQKTQRIQARALLANDRDMQAILKTLGTDVRGMSFAPSKEAWNGLISGKLIRVTGGIYELLFGELPKAACDALEKLAGIGEIFGMGFVCKGELYGNAIIVMREGSQLSNRDVVETFIRQAGVALQRKLADEALKKSEERYRTLVETMTEGLGVQDEKGVWTYVNDRLCAMLGYFHGEIIGRPVTEFFDETNQTILKEQMEKRRKGDSSPYEITWTRKDGRKMTTVVSPKPILDTEGQFKGSFGVFTDITERKQAEAEAARARSELLHVERLSRLGELTASLAHELNQPLAAILSSAQAALRFLKSPTPDLNLFRTILQNIIQDDKRAAGVSTSLRSMMKREEREREPLNINTILDDVLNLFHSESIVRNVTTERDFDRSLPPVLGDKIQLQQVVLNLVMNAAEAMSERPHENEKRKIILRTQVTDHGILVAVRDFGPGIDPAKLDDIWQPFSTTKSTGLGMGLNISRTIIQAHGGRIWAENHPDGGAMFTFEIPVISKQ
jgi:PAS domain S-box-containing protein